MRLYVIGPVTGKPDLNRPAFEDARAELAAAGYGVSIPHDFIPPDADHARAMRMSLHNLLDNADGVAMLDGWASSDGARTEFEVAAACGIEARGVRSWVRLAKDGR